MNWFTNATLAATCWGMAPFFEKAGLRGATDPTVGVFVRTIGVLLGALVWIPFYPNLKAQISIIPTRNLIYLCIGGLLASIVGQAFFYRALKAGEVSRAVSVGASYPIIACLLGLLIFHEPMNLSKGLGVVLVVIGITLLR